MNDHPRAEALERYASGDVSVAEARALEAHLGQCAACAAQLSREVALEVALQQVATTPAAPRRAARTWRWTLALAAGIAALALLGRSPGRAPPALVLTACPDPGDQSGCAEDAQLHGRFVQYPAEGAFPRYELLALQQAQGLTAVPPPISGGTQPQLEMTP